MISEELRARIRRLYYGEHFKIGTIVSQLGVHESTVRRAVGIDAFATRGRARPSDFDPYIEFVRQTLEQYPKLTGTRVHEMIRARGYPGSAVQVRRMIRKHELRPVPLHEVYFQLHTLPGEQAQVDWGDFGTIDVMGHPRRLFGFVMVLSWSRAICVYFTLDMKTAAVMRGHVVCFEYFGGVARTLLYDNMKTVVLERDGDAIRFHPTFNELKGHYLFNARACRPRRAHEKGRVERAIRYLRDSFFAGRHFADLEDLREQFAEWQREIAHKRPCPQDKSKTVEEALEIEREHLLELPEHPLAVPEVRATMPKKQPYVSFDTNRYSIPPACVGRPLSIVATEETVRVEHQGETVAEHARCWRKHQVLEKTEHIDELAELKARGREPKGRERVLVEVPEAEAIYQSLIATHERLQPHTMRLMRLIDEWGAEAVREAVALAIERGTPRSDSVAYLLEKEIRNHDEPLAIRPRWGRRELDDMKIRHHKLEDYDELD